MRRWDGLVTRYMDEYAALGRSPERQDNVRRELDRFGSWLKRRRPPPKLEEVGADLVTEYLGSRCSFKAKATLASVMSILRGFGAFLEREAVWKVSPLRWMKGPKLSSRSRLPRRILREDLEKLLEGAAKHRTGYWQSLWIAILAVFYGAGIRRGELVRLDMKSWLSDEGAMRVWGSKTGRERRVEVPELTWRCVESYLPKRQNLLLSLGRCGEQALFLNSSARRIRGEDVSKGIGRLAARCGLEGLTLHQFRHTCASDLLEAGTKLPGVMKYLGHECIGTTMRYLHVSDPALHKAAALHPINGILRKGGAA